MATSHEEILKLLLQVQGQEDARSLAKSLEDLGDESGQSSSKITEMVQQLDRLVAAAKGTAEFVRLSESLRETEEELDKASRTAYALKLELGSVEKPTKEMEKAFARAAAEVRKLESAQREQADQLERVRGDLRAAGVDTDKLADENTRLRDEATATARALATQAERLKYAKDAAERNAAAFDKMARTLQTARDRLNDMALRLTRVGAVAATTAATLAAYGTARFFGGAIEDATEFQRVLSEVAAVSGATGEQLERMEAAAKEAASESGFSFVEAAQGLGELARATGDAETAIAALPAAMQLARAGGLEVAKAAELTTTTLTQFGLGAENAGRVADVLAKGANVTTASVEQLGNSLSYAAPLARQLGLDLEDTVAIIGALADQGFRGERAGTALRNVMSALADPTSKFNNALRAAGIEAGSFNEMIAELGRRGEEGKKVLLALDAEARPAIMSLVNAGSEGIGRLSGELDKAAGSSAEFARIVRDNLGGAADDAKLAFDNLRLALVDPLLEPLKEELQGLAAELNAFAESEEFEQIRQALKTMFVEGINAAKEFAAQIDFKAVAQRITTFANTSGQTFREFAADVQETAAAIKSAGQGIGIVIDALQTGVLGLATVMAKIAQLGAQWADFQIGLLDSIQLWDELAQAIGIELPDAAGRLAEAAAGLQGVVDEFGNRTADNFDQLRVGLDSFGGAFNDAAGQAEQGAARIGNAGTQVGQAGAAAAQGAAEIGASAATVAAELTGLGNTTEIQTGRMVEASTTAAQRLKELTDQATALQQQLKAAVLAGADPEAIAGIVAQYDAVQAEIQQTQQLLDKAGVSTAQAGAHAQQAAQGFQQVGQAAQQSSRDVAQATGDVARYGGQVEQSANTMLGTLQALNAEFAAVSENARQRFVEIYNELAKLRPTVEGVWDAMRVAAEKTRLEVEQQRGMIEASIGGYIRLAQAGEHAFRTSHEGANLSSQQLEAMAQAIREGRGQFELMNQADLDRLASSIDRVRERVARLEEEARQAAEELRRMADALQDEADRRAGNEEEILRRQHEERLRQIEELAKRGGAAAAEEAARARRLAEQQYAAELERIRAQREAERQAHLERMEEAKIERDTRRDFDTSSGGGGSGGSNAAGGRGPSRVEVVFRNEQLSGSVLGRLSEEDMQLLVQRVLQQIQFAQGASFG